MSYKPLENKASQAAKTGSVGEDEGLCGADVERKRKRRAKLWKMLRQISAGLCRIFPYQLERWGVKAGLSLGQCAVRLSCGKEKIS